MHGTDFGGNWASWAGASIALEGIKHGRDEYVHRGADAYTGEFRASFGSRELDW